jgi:hypothetical protein
MQTHRDQDMENRTFFRSDRMVLQNGQWYFTTREGVLQGPFADKAEAQRELDEYIGIMKAHSAGELSLAPRQPLVFPATTA